VSKLNWLTSEILHSLYIVDDSTLFEFSIVKLKITYELVSANSGSASTLNGIQINALF
jgi:hypothetical protein